MHVDDSVVVVKCEFNNAYLKHQSKFQKVQEKKEKEKNVFVQLRTHTGRVILLLSVTRYRLTNLTVRDNTIFKMNMQIKESKKYDKKIQISLAQSYVHWALCR